MNPLKSKYDFLKDTHIQKMLGSFSKTTDLYIEGIDVNGNTMIKPMQIEKSEFCKYIQGKDGCKGKCRESYKNASNEAFKWRQPYYFRCHTGLVMWCVPIIIDEENVGSIICGQVLLWEPDEFTYEEMRSFNEDIEDFEELKSKIKKLKIISPDKTKAIADMMSMFVNYIININAKNISQQEDIVQWKDKVRVEFDKKKNEKADLHKDYSSYYEAEKKLIQHIRLNETKEAEGVLPLVFTELMVISNYSVETTKLRCKTLISIMSRALMEGGGDSKTVINSCENLYKEIDKIKDLEAIFSKIQSELIEFMEPKVVNKKDKHASTLRKAKQFILENHSENIFIEDVAEYISISTSHLSNIFKTELNYTVNEYINKVRVEEAKEVMKSRELTMQEIALKVGFNSQSYFTKVFKKYIGVTPIQYRNKFL